jgi:protein-L-isoaspartate(D-aspartate) O-methyltransferase
MKKLCEDTLRQQALRKQLIKTVRDKGVTDDRVLEAMMKVPRHCFMDTALDTIAYEDRAFPIAAGQTISQPFTVAYQTELLRVKPYEKILEIGTGSAYQATILAEMKAQVFTIERQKELFDERLKNYPFAGKYPLLKFFYGDGFKGLPTFAPFDKILVTAAAPYIPLPLTDQLKHWMDSARIGAGVGAILVQTFLEADFLLVSIWAGRRRESVLNTPFIPCIMKIRQWLM